MRIRDPEIKYKDPNPDPESAKKNLAIFDPKLVDFSKTYRSYYFKILHIRFMSYSKIPGCQNQSHKSKL